MPEAVIFDIDGVLLDSEQLWNEVKEGFVRDAGGHWREEAPTAMMGMSSPEWAVYIRDSLGVSMDPAEINREVLRRMESRYAADLPLLPGAVDAVQGVAARWPVGLASSSNRELIDLLLELSGLDDAVGASVSSEEVARGKPAPDVYIEAARALSAEPARCVAVEDSENGIRAAAAAGMTVIAVPNPHYPPGEDAMALAAATVAGVEAVSPGLIEEVGGSGGAGRP